MKRVPTPAIDVPQVRRLPAALPRAGVSDQARTALRQMLGDVDRALKVAFARGVDAKTLSTRRSEVVSGVVAHVWTAFVGDSADVALFAVGGFGRGLLFPHSDVDLLVLSRQEPQVQQNRALEHFLRCLWDLDLNPGHAVRDLAHCRTLAENDVSVFTSLMDARRLGGTAELDSSLAEIVETLWPAQAYFEAKRADQASRYARYDDTAYNLEPNLKEAPGGLRTLDLMRWLGARVVGAGTLRALAEKQWLAPGERDALLEAETTLQRYRFALHLEAGRAEERLLFDYQRALAGRLGFEDEHAQNLGVEQFMQGYYRAAQTVERVSAQLFERFEELLEPAENPPRALEAGFVAAGNRLDSERTDLFLKQPEALVRAFIVRASHPEIRGFTADAMRRIQQALSRHGDTLAGIPAVLEAFLELLRMGAPAAGALSRMNRHGVLAAILPAFGRVVGRMQYDLFHVYTVDEHTIRVLQNVARFGRADARREFPIGCEIWDSLDKHELLLLAALFHDIAKGRGGDHSQLGEDDARAFCARLGLPEADIELVAWLVRWHLLMSTTAQRQDITDPGVVHAFATRVKDWERLDYLYLLTVADISGTSPKLWNAWKDRLLADLYIAARYALRSDLALPLRAETRIRDCRERALRLLVDEGVDTDAVARVWADFPDASFLRHRSEQIAWQTAAIVGAGETSGPLVEVHPFSVRGCAEVFIYAPDRDGLFAAVGATLDRLRFSVVEARVLSSRSGKAMDTFLLLESDSQQPASPERAQELREALDRALSERPYRTQPVRRGLSRHLRHFQMAPRIEFVQDSAAARTQLALVCTDRPGLLAAVAQSLREARVRVHDARIATFGERVEDFFQLTDREDLPLSQERQQAVRQALLKRIGSGDPSTRGAYARAAATD